MKQMFLIFLVGFVGLLGGFSSATCPDADTSLRSFTDAFPNHAESDDVVVTDNLLLDVDVDVNTITISGDGKLVFKQQNLVIKTKGILIKDNGQLIIGSDDCRFTNKVDILLKGKERETNRTLLTGAGEKYIAVQDQGRLKIWGEDKLSYTKLTQTVKRFDDPRNSNCVFLHHKASSNFDTTWGQQGLAMYVINSSLDVKSFVSYDFNQRNYWQEQRRVNAMVSALDNDVEVGDMVMIALHNYLFTKDETNLTILFTKIETLSGMSAGDLYLRNNFRYDAWAMVFVKIAFGETPNFKQAYDEQKGKIVTRALASIEYSGKKASAYSEIYGGKDKYSWIDFRILHLSIGYPTLHALDPVGDMLSFSHWSIGDSVLVTTTDYASDHGEVRTIKAITKYTVILEDELNYNHFGEIEDGIDMRAEIALLSRSIKIHGEMVRDCPESHGNQCKYTNFDTYGAHIKINHNFSAIHLEGFELYHVGQATDKGFYPIHFHVCGDVNNREAIVKQVSIHDSFSRAITVHATYGTGAEDDADNKGVQLIDNIAYNVFGHCYFLEDGAEPGTVMINNLAAYVRNIGNSFKFATDRRLATAFWITNPKVKLVNNTVAGSQGFCYWYTFPLVPVGEGKNLNVFKKFEARNTPLWTFDNNVGHSCDRGGFNFDNVLKDDNGNTAGCMNYKSLVNPLDKTSAPKKNVIRMTAYKNLNINIWARGGYFEFVGCSVAHSRRAFQFARGSNQQMTINMCAVRGTGGGNVEEPGYPDAPSLKSLPHALGFVFYDGPSYSIDSFFTGFESNKSTEFVAGAYGFQPKNKFTSSVVSTIRGSVFSVDDTVGGDFNRLFDGNTEDPLNAFGNFDGDESATTRDYDGSVTKCPDDASWIGPKQIVKPEKFVVTKNCKYRDNWNMAICDDLYGKFNVFVKETFPSQLIFNRTSEMRRTHIETGEDAFEDHTGNRGLQFMVMLDSQTKGYKYDFQFAVNFPKRVIFEAKAVERDFPMIVGVCLPEGVTRSNFTLSARMPDSTWHNVDSSFIGVNSMTELNNDSSGRRYFLDGRMLYYKYQSGVRRDPDWDDHDTDHCPSGMCPLLTIILKEDPGYSSSTKCFHPTPEQLNTDFYTTGLTVHDCDLPASTRPPNMGRGDTRSDVDGGWGLWGKWEDKCYTVDDKPVCSRVRVCDNPPRFGDGADCAGSATETSPCKTPCPVNGVWNIWTEWSDCKCNEVGSEVKTSGTRTRTRTCLGPYNYGESCRGEPEEQTGCAGYCKTNDDTGGNVT